MLFYCSHRNECSVGRHASHLCWLHPGTLTGFCVYLAHKKRHPDLNSVTCILLERQKQVPLAPSSSELWLIYALELHAVCFLERVAWLYQSWNTQEDKCKAVCLLYSLGIGTRACRSTFLLIFFVLGFLVFFFAWDLFPDRLLQEVESKQAGSRLKDVLFHTTDNFIVEHITVRYCRGLFKWIQKITERMSTRGY